MADTIILKIDLQNEAQVIEGLKNIDKLADKLRSTPIKLKLDGVTKEALAFAKAQEQAAKAQAQVAKAQAQAAKAQAQEAKAQAQAAAATQKTKAQEAQLAAAREKTSAATQNRMRAEAQLAVQMEKTATAEEAARKANIELSTQIEKTNTVKAQQALEDKKLATEQARLATQQEKTATAAEAQATAQARLAAQQEKTATATENQATAQEESNQSMGKGAKSASLLGDSLGRIIAKVAAWQAINAAVASVKRSFTEALETMKAVDTELTTIQKVTDMSDASLKKLGDTAYSTASKYGVAADEYLQNIATFSKAGYGDLAEGLGELAIKTQLVGDVNAETASKFLLSTDAAYKYNGSVEALSAVLDKANAVENNYATSIEKIAEGMPIVASVAEMANISVEETIAALGTITAKTQESGTSAARAFRALILNIIGDTETEIEDGVTWSADEIESLNDVLWTYSRSAMEAAQATGEIVNPMVAIAGLSQAMEDGLLTEAKLAEIATSLGGKLRTNQLVALIENYGTVVDMLGTMETAAGSADKEVETMLGSWEKKTQVLKNTWTETVASYLDTDTIKGALDGLTTVVDGLDSGFGKTAVSATAFASGGMLAASAATSIAGSIAKAAAAAGGLNAALLGSPLFWGAAAGLAIYAIVEAVDALTVSYEEAAEAAEALNQEYETKYGAGSRLDELKNKVEALTAAERVEKEVLEAQKRALEEKIALQEKAAFQKWEEAYGQDAYIKTDIASGTYSSADEYRLVEIAEKLKEANEGLFETQDFDAYLSGLDDITSSYEEIYSKLTEFKEQGQDLSDAELRFMELYEQNAETANQFASRTIDAASAVGMAAYNAAIAAGASAEEAITASNEAIAEYLNTLRDVPDETDTKVEVDTLESEEHLKIVQSMLESIDGTVVQAKVEVTENLPDINAFGGFDREAKGTDNAPGGPTLVNEKGPELISTHGIAYIAGGGQPTVTNLPKGATVLTAEETKKAVGGLNSVTPVRAFEEGTGGLTGSEYLEALRRQKEADLSEIERDAQNYVKSTVSQNNSAFAMTPEEVARHSASQIFTETNAPASKPSGGAGKGTYSAAPDFKALEDELDDILSNLEAQAELADNQGQHSKEGDLYGQAREKIQELLDKYRAAGYSETSDEVLELQNMLYDYAEQQEEAYRHTWDELEDGLDAALDNINAQIEKAENENDIERQMALYGQAQEKIGKLLNQYLEAGFAPTSDEVLRLANLGYDYAGKQTKLTESLLDDLIDALNGLNDTTDRAKSLEEKQLAVEEAQKAYDAAQNQRTVRIFNPITGQWEWVSKASDVLSAQKSLESAQDTLREEQFSQAVDRLKRGELKLEDLLLDEAVSSQFSAASDAEKQNFLSALGAYSGGVSYGASTAYNNTTNSQTDSHDIVYNFNGVTIGKDTAEGMTLAKLASELRILNLT